MDILVSLPHTVVHYLESLIAMLLVCRKLTAMKQNMEAEYLTVMKTLKEEFEQRPDVEP